MQKVKSTKSNKKSPTSSSSSSMLPKVFQKQFMALIGSPKKSHKKSNGSKKKSKKKQKNGPYDENDKLTNILERAVDLCDDRNCDEKKKNDFNGSCYQFTFEMNIDDRTWEEFRDSLPLRERR